MFSQNANLNSLDLLDQLALMDIDDGAGAESVPAAAGATQANASSASLSRQEGTISVPGAVIRSFLWNIQDLGGGPAQGATRPEAVKQAIAALILKTNADFVALLELKKTGYKLKKPVEPRAPMDSRSSAIKTYFHSETQNPDLGRRYKARYNALKLLVPEFVYDVVTTCLWDVMDLGEAADDEVDHVVAPVILDAEELDAAIDDLLESLNQSGGREQPAVVKSLKKAATLAPRKWQMQFRALAEQAVTIANDGVTDWAGVELHNSGAWPKTRMLPALIADYEKSVAPKFTAAKKGARTKKRKSRAAKSKPVVNTYVDALYTNYKQYNSENRLPALTRDKDPIVVAEHRLAQIARCQEWLKTHPLPMPPSYTAMSDSSPAPRDDAYEAAYDLVTTLEQNLLDDEQAIRAFHRQCSFVLQVADHVLAPLLSCVVEQLIEEEKSVPTDFPALTEQPHVSGLPLANEFLNGCIQARTVRYNKMLAQYEEKQATHDARGTYPGLREFHEIVKLINPQGDYEVWPPLYILEKLEQESKSDVNGPGGLPIARRQPKPLKRLPNDADMIGNDGEPLADEYSNYFTKGESYGVLYKKKLFEAYDPNDDGLKLIPQIGPLPGYEGRAPFEFPLRVKTCGTIIRFLPWHAPAPSSKNSAKRAHDFQLFIKDAANFRVKGQIAVLLSDTNVDTSADALDKPVEFWKGSVPSPGRAALFDAWAGEAGTLLGLGVGTRKTSLVATKVVLNDDGTYRFNNAAYDKSLIVSSSADEITQVERKPQSLLIQGRQQVVSAARAMQHGKPGTASGTVLSVEEPSSPIVRIAKQLPSELIADLRVHGPADRPKASVEVLQLIKDARKVSDHDGVLSEMFLIRLSVETETAQTLIDEYRKGIEAAADVAQQLAKLLSHLERANIPPAYLGHLLDKYVFSNKSASFALVEAPKAPDEPTEQQKKAWRQTPQNRDDDTAMPDVDAPKSSSGAASSKSSTITGLVVKKVPALRARDSIRNAHQAVIKNDGGGACLFYSVCQLHSTPGPAAHAAYGLRIQTLAYLNAILERRQAVASNFFRKLEEMFDWHRAGWPEQAMYQGADVAKWPKYVAEMSKPNAWGDLIMLFVMSAMYNCRYFLYVQLGSATWTDLVVANEGAPSALHHILCTNAFHWEAVIARRRPVLNPAVLNIAAPGLAPAAMADSEHLGASGLVPSVPGKNSSKRSRLADTTFEVQLVSSQGAGSGAPGFAHVDVSAAIVQSNSSMQLPVRIFPPSSLDRSVDQAMSSRIDPAALAAERAKLITAFEAGLSLIDSKILSGEFRFIVLRSPWTNSSGKSILEDIDDDEIKAKLAPYFKQEAAEPADKKVAFDYSA